MCQGLLIGCEKVMNEEEDRLLYDIISLMCSLINLMVNLCKRCIFNFLEEEVASKLSLSLYCTHFSNTPIN